MRFDPVEYMSKLREAEVSEAQARVQTDALLRVIQFLEEKQKEELATKGDINLVNINIEETKLRLQSELKETELRLQNDLKETELRLYKEIQKTKYSLLRWQLAGWVALAGIMAKGFGWIGFSIGQ